MRSPTIGFTTAAHLLEQIRVSRETGLVNSRSADAGLKRTLQKKCVCHELGAGIPGAGRAKLRLSRGFPPGLARQRHPQKVSLGLLIFHAALTRCLNFSVAHLSCDINGRAFVVDSNDLFKGVMSQGSATREAPAQAELRPTCAGTPRFSLPKFLALMRV